MEFKLTLPDPDLWLKPVTALYALKYYTYILVYVDDILIFYKDLGNYMAMIEEKYTVNPDSIRNRRFILGQTLVRFTILTVSTHGQ